MTDAEYERYIEKRNKKLLEEGFLFLMSPSCTTLTCKSLEPEFKEAYLKNAWELYEK